MRSRVERRSIRSTNRLVGIPDFLLRASLLEAYLLTTIRSAAMRARPHGSSWAHLSLAVIAALAFAGMCSVATYAYLDDRAHVVERR
jgi:hypothetical protein